MRIPGNPTTQFVTRGNRSGIQMPKPLMSSRKSAARVISKRQERESPRTRGYDSRWDRLSAFWRKIKPFCAFCKQEDRVRFAVLVDHKIPVADGGQMYDHQNLQSLCRPCHGLKYEMEEFARSHSTIEFLQVWCDDPAERPTKFRGKRLT